MLEKGNVYWYKYKQKKYCCAILEAINNSDYLIAISEELNKGITKPSKEDAKESVVYTLAWFDNLTVLPAFRLHLIYKENISFDYHNRAGIWIDEDRYINNNPGSRSMWKHEYRNYAIYSIKLSDTFCTQYIPKTVNYR